MKLQNLLYKAPIISIHGDRMADVVGVCIDSRKAQPGALFIALKGEGTNGHLFIEKSIENGAAVIVCEALPTSLHEQITYVLVADTALAAGFICHQFFGEPSESLKLIGVTGTNGKTTVATVLYKLYTAMGFVCGLVSTVQNQIADRSMPSTHTTPDVVALNALLHEMVEAGCTHVFMECSSHAIQQQRIAGLVFTGAIFTNITHDHLDYHKTFDEYIRVKKSWFDALPSTAFAISNADDKRGKVMLQNTKAKKYYYSLKTLTDFKGKILDNSLLGLHMTVNETEVYFKMIGEFNAYNLLAVFAAATCMGQFKDHVLLELSRTNGAEGRFDYFISDHDKIVGIVDYAHTPDALLNVLATIKNLRQGHEKILTVVGCGGDRDKTKRSIMGEVACEHSDKVIFTSDNPRSEEAAEIIKEMEKGVSNINRKKYISVADRYEAIKTAASLAGKEDIVLIAGKGHEKYQEIKGVKNPFDDKEVLKEVFELLDK